MQANESIGWKLRPYRAGDEARLVALFARVFGQDHSVDWWHWKLKGRASNIENVWVAVTDDERIIAQYAGIPVRMKLGAQEHAAMVSVDTMTDPQFRRRGILTELANAAYSSWADAGVAAVIGLPNQQWGSRTAALGWERLFPLPWLRWVLRPDQVIAHSGRLPGYVLAPTAALASIFSRLNHRIVKGRLAAHAHNYLVNPPEKPGDFDRLWAIVGPEYQNLAVRDAEWVSWRYIEPSEPGYHLLMAYLSGEPVGYLAYRIVRIGAKNTGLIADLFVAPADQAATNALLLRALDDLWARKATTVATTAPPGTSLFRLLRAAGFGLGPGSFSFEIVPLDRTLDLAVLQDPATWQLSPGDFDIV